MRAQQQAAARRHEAVTRYVRLTKRVHARQGQTGAFFALGILVYLAFAAWGFLIAALVSGECDRPIRGIVVALSVVFLIGGVLSSCLYLVIRNVHAHVVATGGQAQSNPDDIRYRSVPQSDTLDADDDDLDLFERTRDVTDQLTVACCSYACLIVVFITNIIFLFVVLSWVLLEKNNCGEKAPDLVRAARNYLFGLMGAFLVHAVWYGLACRECGAVAEVYQAQQRLSSWSSSRQYHPRV